MVENRSGIIGVNEVIPFLDAFYGTPIRRVQYVREIELNQFADDFPGASEQAAEKQSDEQQKDSLKLLICSLIGIPTMVVRRF